MIGEVAGRLGSYAARRISLRAAASLLCLAIVLGSISAALGSILRGQDIFRLSLIAMIGMLVTWRLASLPLRGGQAAFLLALLGAGLILLGVEELSNKLFALDRTTLRWIWSAFGWRLGQSLPDPALAIQLGKDLLATLWATIARTAHWSAQLARGKPAADLFASSLAWAYLIWCASAWAAWATCRLDHPLLGVLPGAAVLAASLSFTWAEALYLVPVLSGTLFLMALQNYFKQEQRWQKNSLDFAEDLRFDASMWSLAFVIIITFTAILASLFSPQQTLAIARNLLHPRPQEVQEAGNALGLEKKTANQPAEEFSNPGVLPRKHLLGAGPELSQRIAMLIRPDNAGLTGESPPQRLYWRLLNFDLYTGRGWMTSATTRQTYPPNQALPSSSPESFRALQAQIQVVGDLGTGIYAAGDLVSVDQRFQVFRRQAPEGELDFFSASLDQTPAGGVYRVTSSLPLASAAELEASGSDYPLWIKETYLQLPQKTPARVIDLANRLTQNQPNSYLQARLIESYLRSIPYSLDVPLPPADRDVVDYYLFDLRKGYCDYAASAMVVLARAIGLPSRLVIGYAPGRYDPQNGLYVVTEAEAHSWAQIYFNGIGWIDFEPTSGRLANLSRGAATPVLPPEFNVSDNPPAARARLPWNAGLLGLAVAIIGLALAWIIWLRLDALRLDRMESREALVAIYLGMHRFSPRLGLPRRPGDTPGEFAIRLSQAMQTLERQGLSRWLAPAAGEIRQIADWYAQSIYSPHPPGRERSRQASATWKELRRRRWAAWALRNLRRKI